MRGSSLGQVEIVEPMTQETDYLGYSQEQSQLYLFKPWDRMQRENTIVPAAEIIMFNTSIKEFG
jgi:hypothetical protein